MFGFLMGFLRGKTFGDFLLFFFLDFYWDGLLGKTKEVNFWEKLSVLLEKISEE